MDPIRYASATTNQGNMRRLLKREGIEDRAPEGVGVEGWIPIKFRHDLLEEHEQPARLDEAAVQHCRHIALILAMTALDLGEALRIEIVVMKRKRSFASDEWTSFFPAGKL